MTPRRHVLLTTEGTYPFHGGGVSTWCDVLLSNLREVDFTLIAVAMNPYLLRKYAVPANVREVRTVPLWGIEEPAEYAWDAPFPALLRRRWETTEEILGTEFIPCFERFVQLALGSPHDTEPLAAMVFALHEFFLRYDYHRSMRTPEAWKAFQQGVAWARRSGALTGGEPTFAELAEAMRLLYRFLLVLERPVPRSDVAHSSAAGFCGLPCVIAKLRDATPYLLTEHGVYLREQYLNLRRHVKSPFVRAVLYRLVEAVVRLSYATADQVSPVCHYNARWERWFGVPAARIRVIHNGADPARFTCAAAREAGPPRVSSVGLIYPLKAQRDLIDASALVREAVPGVQFAIYGSVSDQEYYEECTARLRSLGVEDTVSFKGTTANPAAVYQQADVVALPSVSEAFPYALIEAMLCGAAIVSTDVGGSHEALGETGVLVRPGRPSELAEAITRLLHNPAERRRLGAAARRRALERFTLETVLDQYRATYVSLAGAGARPEVCGRQVAGSEDLSGVA